jgi:hypothetical protein
MVENIFITSSKKRNTKEFQFKGLEAVVKYLCELDGISNVMDYTSLFEYNDKNEPIKELSI